MADSLSDFVKDHERILVFGAGGGGDALGALLVYFRVKELGGQPILGSVVWERHPVDPYPGPIPLEVVINAEPLGWSSALVDGSSVALRYGREVRFQLARVLEALGEKGVFIDLTKGVYGVASALRDVAEALDVKGVIAVDTGGDILAVGCEDNLWSPLADAVSLAGTVESGLPSLVTVLGPGADGELSQELVLRYIAELARRRALVEITGPARKDVEYISGLIDKVYSEASKIPIIAFQGEYGERRIRGGTRTVKVNPVSATMYLLETSKVYEWSSQAQAVSNTRGIGQAKERLNQHCVVTELDLELELSRLRETGSQRSLSVDEIRRELRRRLMIRGCTAFECPINLSLP